MPIFGVVATACVSISSQCAAGPTLPSQACLLAASQRLAYWLRS